VISRELAIVLRARVTWIVAGLAALLVGHGFVLAVDLFTAGSRSVAGNVLMAREFDPLAGIVRPTLGGLYLAASLLGPIAAARAIAVEKERRSFGALVLLSGSHERVVLAKYLAALAGGWILLTGPLAAIAAWRAVGGQLAFRETVVALVGHGLYIALVTAVATAAAAWSRTVAQAATLAVVVVLASWAIDASEGFAALAWLGRLADWSVTTHLTPFERGILPLGAAAWMLSLTAGCVALSLVGARFDVARGRRTTLAMAVIAVTAGALVVSSRIHRAYDFTEAARASLPPAAVAGLRAITAPITLEVYLDRDDSRRRQMESDIIARLRLALGDIRIEYPLDGREAPSEATHDDGYGRIIVRVGGRHAETQSTSRREVTTLIFEAAGQPLPDWSQPAYPGYPLVVGRTARRALGVCAYIVFPGALFAVGFLVTRSKRRTS